MPLYRAHLIRIWHRGKVNPGDCQESIFRENIEKADLILLLVSADFNAHWDTKLSAAVRRSRDTPLRVVPVILRPCVWNDLPFFGLQPLPKSGQPLVEDGVLREGRIREAIEEIRQLVAEIRYPHSRKYPPSTIPAPDVVTTIALLERERQAFEERLASSSTKATPGDPNAMSQGERRSIAHTSRQTSRLPKQETSSLHSPIHTTRTDSPHAALLNKLNVGKHPQAQISHDETIPFGPVMQVDRFMLGNGVRMLALVDTTATTAALHIWLGVGSRHDPPGKTGLAYLVQRMVWGPTTINPHVDFDQEANLDALCARMDGAVFLDWTSFGGAFPSDAFETAIMLHGRRLGSLLIDDAQVEMARQHCLSERRKRVDEDFDGNANEALYRVAFREHAYGQPTCGTREDLLSAKPDDCEAFYRAHYVPANVVVVVVGRFELETLLESVQEHYGRYASRAPAIEYVRPEPPQTAERHVHLEAALEAPCLAIGYRAPALGDADYAPLVVLNEILMGGTRSRANKKLVRELRLLKAVRGWVGTFRDPALYDIGLTINEGCSVTKALTEFDLLIEQLQSEPVSGAELARAKARHELTVLQSLETTEGRAENIAFHEVVALGPVDVFRNLRACQVTTANDVLRVARKYLQNSARSVVQMMPSEPGSG